LFIPIGACVKRSKYRFAPRIAATFIFRDAAWRRSR
jgi:hypothetical protein